MTTMVAALGPVGVPSRVMPRNSAIGIHKAAPFPEVMDPVIYALWGLPTFTVLCQLLCHGQPALRMLKAFLKGLAACVR